MEILKKQVALKDVIVVLGLFIWAVTAWNRFERVEGDVLAMQANERAMATNDQVVSLQEEMAVDFSSLRARQRRYIDRFNEFSEDAHGRELEMEHRLATLEAICTGS